MSLCFQLSVALDKQELLSPIPRFYLQHKKTGVGMLSVEGKAEEWTCKAQSEGGSVALVSYFRFISTQIFGEAKMTQIL